MLLKAIISKRSKTRELLNFLANQKISSIATTNATIAVLPFENKRIFKKIINKVNHISFLRRLLNKNLTKATNATMPAYLPNPVGRVPAIPKVSICARTLAKPSYGL